MAEPEINIDRRWWQLKADTTKITSASTGWKNLGTAVDKAGDDVFKKAKVVYDDGWEGKGRTAYEGHQKKISKALVDLKAKADAVDTALDNIASVITSKQGQLTTAENDITGAVACVVSDATINFKPANPDETKKVNEAYKTAKGIRADLDKQLNTEVGKLDTAATDFAAVSSTWQAIANGTTPAFDLPPEPKNAPRYITLPDGRTIVNTGTGNDDVKVTTDDKGNVIVTVNGQSRTLPPGTDVTVRGGQGDDTINVGTDKSNVTALGGDGNDKISSGVQLMGLTGPGGDHTFISGTGDDSVTTGGGNNRISTGAGNDFVWSGDGNDKIATYDGEDSVLDNGGTNDVSTGRGEDVANAGGTNHVYAGEDADKVTTRGGNDVIAAGDGQDRVNAGAGNDRVFGGGETDYIDGQDGDDYLEGGNSTGQGDTVYGGDGDDTMIGGTGNEYMDGGTGNDKITGGSGDDMLSGGKGDDDLDGGKGSDVMYSGFGKDSVTGDADDTAYIQNGEDSVDGVGTKHHVEPIDADKLVADGVIDLEGSEEFKDRVLADLNTFGASPTGKEMLNLYKDHMSDTFNNDSLTIKEVQYDPDNPERDEEGDLENNYFSENGTFGDDIVVELNPAHDIRDLGDGPGGAPQGDGEDGRPALIFYHELAHGASTLLDVYDGDQVGGNGPDQDERKSERQAVGLPTDGREYDPNNPSANLDMDYKYTENGLRDEMGLEARETYSSDGR